MTDGAIIWGLGVAIGAFLGFCAGWEAINARWLHIHAQAMRKEDPDVTPADLRGMADALEKMNKQGKTL